MGTSKSYSFRRISQRMLPFNKKFQPKVDQIIRKSICFSWLYTTQWMGFRQSTHGFWKSFIQEKKYRRSCPNKLAFYIVFATLRALPIEQRKVKERRNQNKLSWERTEEY